MARTAILGLMAAFMLTAAWGVILMWSEGQMEAVRKTYESTDYKIWIDNRRAEMEEGYVSQKCAR